MPNEEEDKTTAESAETPSIETDKEEQPEGSETSTSASGSGTESKKSSSDLADKISNPKGAVQDAALGKAKEKASETKLGAAAVKTAETAQKVGQTVQATQTAVANAVSSTKSLIASLSNPWVLLVIAIILVITLLVLSVITHFQVLGKNPNAESCAVSQDGTVTVEVGGESWQERSNALASWLMSTEFEALGGKPMTKEQAAGVIGNFVQESQLDPRAVQNKGESAYFTADSSNDDLMGGSDQADGNAAGISQWDGIRRKNLAKFAKDRGLQWNSSHAQLEFLLRELNSSDQKRRLSSSGFTDDGQDAAHYVVAFEEAFTRAGQPNYTNRIAAAEEFMVFYKGGTGSASGTSCLSGDNARVAASCYPVDGMPGWCYMLEPTNSWVLNTYAGHAFEAKDIPGPRGTPMYAVTAGTVVESGPKPVGSWCSVSGAGSDNPSQQYEIKIQMDEPYRGASSYLYAHMQEDSPLKVGDRVKGGDFVGYLGNTGCSTGPHLHFEFTRGSGVDPISIFGRSF